MRNERGATMIMIAIAMTAMLGMVALAVDVGMLFNVRSEAQRAADAAALAGAGSLIGEPGNESRARATAIRFGDANSVNETAAAVLPEDVDVDLAEGEVTVTVRRTADRGSAVATWFARVLGIDAVDVDATATAEVAPAGAATCLKPFSIYDQYHDVDGDGDWSDGDAYEPEAHGYGSDWRDPGQPGDDGLGYVGDFGRPIALKGYDGASGAESCCPGNGPSWYYPWNIPDVDDGPVTGANRYRDNIANCNPAIVSVGEEYQVETGDMRGPTKKGVEDLIALDPSAYWDDVSNSIANSRYTPWESSPRIAIVPTFSPSREFDPGKKPIEFTNFVAVFVESVSGNGNSQVVLGRILYPSGVGGGNATAPAAKHVRLIR